MALLEQLENINHRVWANKITLATTNHTLGLGAGLLIAGTRERRPLAYALIGFALVAHAYAWLTMEPSKAIEQAQQAAS